MRPTSTPVGQATCGSSVDSPAAGGAAALVDGDVFRTMIRRNYFLDPLSVLDDDVAMQERIERIFADLPAKPQPHLGPSRSELIEVMRTALTA